MSQPGPPPIYPPPKPPPPPPKPVPPWKSGKVGCWSLVLVLAGGIALWTYLDPSQSNHQSEVVNACHDSLRGQLAYPDTADWQSDLTTDVKRYAQGYDVSGSVSAENAYGVKSSFTFSCTEAKDFTVLSSYLSPQ